MLYHLDSLTGAAREAAAALLKAFPNTTITSSVRTVEKQARAMADNCVLRRDYIGETYRKPLCNAAQVLHAWSMGHPTKTADELAADFARFINELPFKERRLLSKHFPDDTGKSHAFDVKPVGGKVGEKIIAFLRAEATKRGGRFLEEEGGLVRWHWQAGE